MWNSEKIKDCIKRNQKSYENLTSYFGHTPFSVGKWILFAFLGGDSINHKKRVEVWYRGRSFWKGEGPDTFPVKVIFIFRSKCTYSQYKYAIQLAKSFIPKSFLSFQLFHAGECS